MKDEGKTKGQLIGEMVGERQRIAELKKSAAPPIEGERGAGIDIGPGVLEILDALPFYVLLVDAGHHILLANKAVGRDLGLDPEDIISGYCPKVVNELDEPFYGRPLEEAAEKGHAIKREFFDPRRGRWMQSGVYPMGLRTQDGREVFLHMSRDITERKRMDEERASSEERLRILFEFAPNAYCLSDLKGTLIDSNRAAEEITGYSRDELVGKNFLQLRLLPVSQIPKAKALLARNALGQPTGPDEFTLTRKEGTQVQIEIRTLPVKIEGKTLVLVIARDITGRKRSEEELQESEARYRDLFENAHDMIQSVALDGHFIFANRAWLETLGYTEADLPNLNLFEIIAPESLPHCQEMFAKVMAGECVKNVEATFVAKDGRRIQVEGNATVRRIGDKVVATQGIFNDITERKRAQEQLKDYSEKLEAMVEERTRELEDAHKKLVQAEKFATIGELAGSVAHELRNPQAAVKAATYFLRMKLAEAADDKVTKHLDILDKEVDACDEIIRRLLGFSEPGKPEFEKVDIDQVVLKAVQTTTPPQNVEISTSLEGNLRPVMADAGQLERVLSSMITNSLQAMPDGGKLSLSTSQKDSFIEVRVADSGVGILAENLNKVFEPLFTTKAKGVGLGLALAKRLIERQGGAIEVESQVGKGTTFTVKLPVASEEVGDP